MTSRKTAPKKKRAAPKTKAKADPQELLGFYRDMLLVRRFEEKAGQMYGMGLIGGFCHLYIGQEAVLVGTRAALSDKESVVTSYRNHGHALLFGGDPNAVMAELTGRAGGLSKGKGGSMHMFDPENGFYGGHGIVAAQVPIGTGLGFAHNYKQDGGVSVTFFGDGAANQGQVYEAFNMAELWRLPVIYVVENNQYAMGTAVKRASAETHLHKRGTSFNIPGREVDGMDVVAVRDAVADGLTWCREGKGPILLEMNTYRYRGHSMSDPAKYRSREEVQEVRAKSDPIDQLRLKLLKLKGVTEARLKEIDGEVREVVAEAAAFAESAPEPEAAELYTEVLS